MRMRFVEISKESDGFKRLQLFARSFDHMLVPLKNQKIIAFEKDEKTFGYADIINVPTIFPAFHPEICNPRSVLEIISGLKTQCEFNNGGQGLFGVPFDQDRSTFPKEMLEKQGFIKLNSELYLLNEGGK